jgi:hypothetical protein
MSESERQLLGVVVICGMLIGVVLATWPHDTPATTPPTADLPVPVPESQRPGSGFGRPDEEPETWNSELCLTVASLIPF